MRDAAFDLAVMQKLPARPLKPAARGTAAARRKGEGRGGFAPGALAAEALGVELSVPAAALKDQFGYGPSLPEARPGGPPPLKRVRPPGGRAGRSAGAVRGRRRAGGGGVRHGGPARRQDGDPRGSASSALDVPGGAAAPGRFGAVPRGGRRRDRADGVRRRLPPARGVRAGHGPEGAAVRHRPVQAAGRGRPPAPAGGSSRPVRAPRPRPRTGPPTGRIPAAEPRRLRQPRACLERLAAAARGLLDLRYADALPPTRSPHAPAAPPRA